EAVLHRAQDCLRAGFAAGHRAIEFLQSCENLLQGQTNAQRLRAPFDQKSAGRFTMGNLIGQSLNRPPGRNPFSPGKKNQPQRRGQNCPKKKPAHSGQFSRSRQPKPRTLSIASAALPSFLRNRRTWVSTVRVSIALSYPQTSLSKRSRSCTRPRRCISVRKSLNSRLVRLTRLPRTETS